MNGQYSINGDVLQQLADDKGLTGEGIIEAIKYINPFVKNLFINTSTWIEPDTIIIRFFLHTDLDYSREYAILNTLSLELEICL